MPGNRMRHRNRASRSNFKDWPGMAKSMNPAVGELHKSVPGPMKAFHEMGAAALEAGALDTKTKELMAVAISVAVRCDPCVAYHVAGAQRAGATREEIAETVGLAVYMGAGPSAMYAAQALEAFDQWRDKAAEKAAASRT